MRILLFTEAFLPPAYQPRIRYFCSYFIEKGWEIDLVTEKSENQDLIPKNIPVLIIDYYKNKNKILLKLEWILKFTLNLVIDYKGLYFRSKSKKFIQGKQYDLVFCSSSFTFPLTTAALVSQNLNIPLYVDLRDIAEQSPDDNHYLANKPPKIIGKYLINIFKKVNLKRRNNVLKTARGVTSVSPWHVQTLKQFNLNTYLLYNGFDENKFIPANIPTAKFTISYFGRIYNEEMRDPRLLFDAINNLNKKGLINPTNTTLQWFLDDASKKVIQKIAREYNLDNYVEYKEFIKPEELVTVMNKSSVLLILSNTNSSQNYFGIMTTKFFEAVGVNKPVLSIPDNNDNLSEIIQKTNSGLVSSNISDVENFIISQFRIWEKQKFTTGNLDENIRMSLSRLKGAEILENIFLTTYNQPL